jgi:hypothetical protein
LYNIFFKNWNKSIKSIAMNSKKSAM